MSGYSDHQHSRSAPDGTGYDAVAKTFHWTVVLLLVVQVLTKLIPTAWVGEDALNAWHVSVGPSILAVMVLRLLWRLTHRPPPPPADLPPALRLLSRATHWAFYGLLIILPLFGWAAASGYGVTPYLFGVVPLPALIAADKARAEALGQVHGALALLLIATIALHVAGALFHLLVKRDGVAQRMLPFTR
jgi:cytochrome b561